MTSATRPAPPRPRHTRRLVILAAIGAVLLLGVTFVALTFGSFSQGLRRREMVVTFRPEATRDQRMAARAACTGLRNATPEPIGPGTVKSARLNDVRFRIDNASSRDIAVLQACLIRQPGVLGFDIPDAY